jgi:hypothetical protein
MNLHQTVLESSCFICRLHSFQHDYHACTSYCQSRDAHTRSSVLSLRRSGCLQNAHDACLAAFQRASSALSEQAGPVIAQMADHTQCATEEMTAIAEGAELSLRERWRMLERGLKRAAQCAPSAFNLTLPQHLRSLEISCAEFGSESIRDEVAAHNRIEVSLHWHATPLNCSQESQVSYTCL